MELIELLIQFGLTRQEAVIYIALCGQGSLTGYEAAKQTGISRSNTYTALAGLVEKGAANTIESNATHYVPVSAAEFCRNKLRNLEKSAQKLVSLIPEAQADADSYITIKGRLHVLDRAKNMIDGAAQRIYLSLSGECLLELLPHFEAAVLRGLKIVIITRSRITLPGAKLYRAYGEKPSGQIRLITDSRYALTGELLGPESTCLYSGKQNLVDLIKDSLRSEIQLIEIQTVSP